jgi:hypothetical protein
MGAVTDWDLLDICDLQIGFKSLIGPISPIDTTAYTLPGLASLLASIF